MTTSIEKLRMTLDVPDMHVTSLGIESFYYPVRQAEVAAVRDGFVDALYALFRAQPIGAGTPLEPIWITMPILCLEIMRAFEVRALARRCSAAGIEPVGRSFKISDDPAGVSRNVANVLCRPRQSGFLRRHVRSLRSRLRAGSGRNGLIVTFVAARLLESYAHSNGLVPRMSRDEEWLAPQRERTDGLDAAALEAVRQGMRHAFAVGGETMDEAIERWLLRTVQWTCGWARHQLAVLRARRRMPDEFWSGSLGNPINRAIATVVRERGGRVVGFDHGMSTGMWDTPIQTMLEFDLADRFVTFTPAMAAGLAANRREKWTLPGAQGPEIVAQYPAGSAVRPVPRKFRPAGRRVVYVPTLYGDSIVHILPFFSDLQMVDWQARMLAFLRERGFEVSIKPHPESVFPIPKVLSDLVDGRIIRERIETLDLDGAVLIFDYPQTTAFGHAVRTDSPIVILDFDRLTIRPEVLPAFDARCVRVPGTVDDRGRIQVDLAQIEAAIADAPSRSGTELVDLYLQ
jgi:hypothetical protein